MALIRFKRGTRAEIDAAATASALNQGEPYYITDESVYAIGTSTTTYIEFPDLAGLSGYAQVAENETISGSWAFTNPIKLQTFGGTTTINGASSGSPSITIPNASGTLELEGHTHTLSDITDAGTLAGQDFVIIEEGHLIGAGTEASALDVSTGTGAGDIPTVGDLGTAALEDVTTSSTDTTSGSIPKIGDHLAGLVNTNPASETDINNYPQGYSLSPTSGHVNFPPGDNSRAIVFHALRFYGVFIVYQRVTGDIYVWNGPAGDMPISSTDFEKLYHTGNLESANLDWTGEHTWSGSYQRQTIKDTNIGRDAISQTDSPGLFLISGGMNATFRYTPGVLFGSYDDQLTTHNPKFLAGIFGYATEAYSGDAGSGMGIEFATTPNNAGASSAPQTRAVIDQDGNVGIGTTSPSEKLDVVGRGQFTDFLRVNGSSGLETRLILNNTSTNGEFWAVHSGDDGNLDLTGNGSGSVEMELLFGGGIKFNDSNNAVAFDMDASGNCTFANPVTFTGKSGTLDYDEDTVTLGNDFDAGIQVKCVRIGSQVTISGTTALGHTSTSIAISSAGIIPSQYRPPENASNAFSNNFDLRTLIITSTGQVVVQHFDYNGNTVSRTSTSEIPSITYNV